MDARLIILAAAFFLVLSSLFFLLVSVSRARREIQPAGPLQEEGSWPMLKAAPPEVVEAELREASDKKFSAPQAGMTAVLSEPLRTGRWQPAEGGGDRTSDAPAADYWDALVEEPALLVRPQPKPESQPAAPAGTPVERHEVPGAEPLNPRDAAASAAHVVTPFEEAPTLTHEAPLSATGAPSADPESATQVQPAREASIAAAAAEPAPPVDRSDSNQGSSPVAEEPPPIPEPAAPVMGLQANSAVIGEPVSASDELEIPAASVPSDELSSMINQLESASDTPKSASQAAPRPQPVIQVTPELKTPEPEAPALEASNAPVGATASEPVVPVSSDPVVHAPEPAPTEAKPVPVEPRRPEPSIPAAEPVVAPASGTQNSGATEIPEHELVAPVEMWFGEARVGVKPGSKTYGLFQKYARVMREDFEQAMAHSKG